MKHGDIEEDCSKHLKKTNDGFLLFQGSKSGTSFTKQTRKAKGYISKYPEDWGDSLTFLK